MCRLVKPAGHTIHANNFTTITHCQYHHFYLKVLYCDDTANRRNGEKNTRNMYDTNYIDYNSFFEEIDLWKHKYVEAKRIHYIALSCSNQTCILNGEMCKNLQNCICRVLRIG